MYVKSTLERQTKQFRERRARLKFYVRHRMDRIEFNELPLLAAIDDNERQQNIHCHLLRTLN